MNQGFHDYSFFTLSLSQLLTHTVYGLNPGKTVEPTV